MNTDAVSYLGIADWLEVAHGVTALSTHELGEMADLHLLVGTLDACAAAPCSPGAEPIAHKAAVLLVRLVRTPPLPVDFDTLAATAVDMFLSGNSRRFEGDLVLLADEVAAGSLDLADVAARLEAGMHDEAVDDL